MVSKEKQKIISPVRLGYENIGQLKSLLREFKKDSNRSPFFMGAPSELLDKLDYKPIGSIVQTYDDFSVEFSCFWEELDKKEVKYEKDLRTKLESWDIEIKSINQCSNSPVGSSYWGFIIDPPFQEIRRAFDGYSFHNFVPDGENFVCYGKLPLVFQGNSQRLESPLKRKSDSFHWAIQTYIPNSITIETKLSKTNKTK